MEIVCDRLIDRGRLAGIGCVALRCGDKDSEQTQYCFSYLPSQLIIIATPVNTPRTEKIKRERDRKKERSCGRPVSQMTDANE